MANQPVELLKQKLNETRHECGVPALAACLVRGKGGTVVAAQTGVRNVQGSGVSNEIQPSDTFNLGSVSKVVSGHLIGVLIGKRIGNPALRWDTTLGEIFPEIFDQPGAFQGYRGVTIEHLQTHTSGMPYQPTRDDETDWKKPLLGELTPAYTRERRMQYVRRAVLDHPEAGHWPPDSGYEYSGGQIITVAMAEKVTGQTYNDLLRTYVFHPLAMGATVGRTVGTWWHAFDATRSSPVAPIEELNSLKLDYHPRHPVGGVTCSASDLASFVREQVVANPKTCSTTDRKAIHTRRTITQGHHIASGWASTSPASESTQLWHIGATAGSYAAVQAYPTQGIGFAAMCNAHATLGAAATSKMLQIVRVMNGNWNHFFGPDAKPAIECAHPSPAIVWGRPKDSLGEFTAFGRRFDGSVVRMVSAGGLEWKTDGDFGPVAINSGVAAASSANGNFVFVAGRGLDNQMWVGAKTMFTQFKWQGWGPIGGNFRTGPGVAVNWDGSLVAVVGIDVHGNMYLSRKRSGGAFDGWTAIGAGVFNSGPAIAMSEDGGTIHVVARGLDFRFWWNVSTDGGDTFNAHWMPIGDTVFTSSPAMLTSANGKAIRVFGRGTDTTIRYVASIDGGRHWSASATPIKHKDSVADAFTSAPAVAYDAFHDVTVVAAVDKLGYLSSTTTRGWGDFWSEWKSNSKHLLF